MKSSKVIILGSGISGMTASIYLKRGGITPIIIENNAPGGTLNIIPSIENYPGFNEISGPDLAVNIYNQTKQLGIEYIYRNIEKIDLKNKIIDNDIKFDYLIIATGRRARLLGLDNEDKYLGRGISTCALCDGTFYKDKEVIVVGGSSSAISEALYLSNICKRVTIIHRGDSYRAQKILIDKLGSTKNIKQIFNANVIKYNIKNNKIIGVTLDNNKKIKADGIFLGIGSIPNSDIFEVEKEDNYIIVDNEMKTNIDYVYAIGDVTKKNTYQLITASSDGIIAADSIIKREINKDK